MAIRYSLRAANGQEYAITGPFRIGREPECQIQVDNYLVSRIHASIWIDHDHLLLRDERSRNGTQLNGQPLAPGEANYLHHDDEVKIGNALFTVFSDPPYPRPRQHRDLRGLAEDEPPPTLHLDKPEPAPPPPPPSAAARAPAPPLPAPSSTAGTAEAPGPEFQARVAGPPSPAAPGRARTLPLVIGGCVLLVILVTCCLLTFVVATTGGPAISTALAPLLHSAATPVP
jgi:FHA domain